MMVLDRIAIFLMILNLNTFDDLAVDKQFKKQTES